MTEGFRSRLLGVGVSCRLTRWRGGRASWGRYRLTIAEPTFLRHVCADGTSMFEGDTSRTPEHSALLDPWSKSALEPPGRAASLALVQAVLLIVGGVIGAIVSAALENQAIGWLLWPAVVMVLAVLAAIGGWLDPRRIGRGWSRIVAVIASIAAIAFAWWSASAATGAWIQVVSIALIWLTATAASWGAFSSTSTWPRVALSTAIITLVVALAGQVIALLSRDDLYTWVGFVARAHVLRRRCRTIDRIPGGTLDPCRVCSGHCRRRRVPARCGGAIGCRDCPA